MGIPVCPLVMVPQVPVNLSWKLQISQSIINIPVVMVTGGEARSQKGGGRGEDHSVKTSVELLSISGARLCTLPNLPAPRIHHSQTGLLTCGGGGNSEDDGSCVTFTAGKWKKTHILGQERYGHAAWASPEGVLLIGGDQRVTTELLTDNGGSTPSFDLTIFLRSRYPT